VFAGAFLLSSALLFACNTASLKQPGPGEVPAEETPEEEAGTSPSLDGATRDPGAQDAGAVPISKGVTVQVQPSDNAAALIAAMRGATKSVHVVMYLLSSDEFINALIDQHKAGRDVKVILNQNFPPGGGDNARAFSRLSAQGVPVVWAPAGYTYTHAKMLIIDAARIIVMTMNMTFTSASTNREFIATDPDADDVADAEKIFEGDYTNTSTAVTGKLVLSPRNTSLVDARARLKALIDGARTSVDVEVQSLSDFTLVDALILAHQAGLKVRVVLDGKTTGNTTSQSDALAKLKQYGVPTRLVSSLDIHAKAIVADGARAFIGSQNFTPTGLLNNREVGVVFDGPAEVAKVSTVIGQDFDKGVAP
jgi:cardiolipin synthase A/B